MATHLEQVRDELAPKFTSDPGGIRLSAWKAGFDAAVRTLAESAGELDRAFIAKAFEDHPVAFAAAVAQFDQDRARIGLAEAREQESERWRKYYKDECAQLTARLAAAEENAQHFDWLRSEAEQRVRELEAEAAKFQPPFGTRGDSK